MRNKNKKRNYYIYAVLDPIEEIAYIADSTSITKGTQLSRHFKGNIACTADDFAENENITFVILQYVTCCRHEILKHVLAWAYYFEMNGFLILMPNHRLAMLEYPKADTLDIYATNCQPYSIDDILSRELAAPEFEPDNFQIQTNPFMRQKKRGSLGIKGDICIIEEFKEYCSSNNITQSEGLMILMNTLRSLEGQQISNSLIQSLKMRDDEINSLKSKVSSLKSSSYRKLVELRQRQKTIRRILIDTINHITNVSSPLTSHSEILYPQNFKVARKHINHEEYKYPKEPGTIEITLEAILRNKSNKTFPLFFLAHDREGNKLKFRYYSKSGYFAGIPPHNEDFAKKNSTWFYGYNLSNDGAADIVASIPNDPAIAQSFGNKETLHDLHSNNMLQHNLAKSRDENGNYESIDAIIASIKANI